MKTIEDARELAHAMVELGERADRRVACLLTDMDQPLGRTVGNALEIREAIATLRGEGPPDFSELVLRASAELLSLSDLGVDKDEGRRLAEQAIADGSASAMYERWVEAQGGNPAEDALEQAPVTKVLQATAEGYVGALRALPVGLAALHLGAGRATKDDAIDYAVGIVCLKKRGDAVAVGEPLAEIHARTDDQADAAARDVAAAYEIREAAPPATPIVLESIG
jgi:pyrimidine-nucleoside phosphorylase